MIFYIYVCENVVCYLYSYVFEIRLIICKCIEFLYFLGKGCFIKEMGRVGVWK